MTTARRSFDTGRDMQGPARGRTPRLRAIGQTRPVGLSHLSGASSEPSQCRNARGCSIRGQVLEYGGRKSSFLEQCGAERTRPDNVRAVGSALHAWAIGLCRATASTFELSPMLRRHIEEPALDSIVHQRERVLMRVRGTAPCGNPRAIALPIDTGDRQRPAQHSIAVMPVLVRRKVEQPCGR